ncbi:MAG TPA: YfiR family protein [Polyangia bacterium]
MAVLLVVFTPALPASAQSSLALDSRALKVAMIGKIAEFVRWPAQVGLDDPNVSIELVVLGRTPLEARLTDYFRKVRIAGHRVFVRFARDLDDVGEPEILFLGPTFEDDVERVVARLKGVPVLTIADTPGFAQRGIAVNLITVDGQVRFEVARHALQRQGLEASYHLLSLARLIDVQQARR